MNTLTDVMNYFHFVMIAVYVLGGITVITTVANIKKKNCRTVFLVISTMVLFALISMQTEPLWKLREKLFCNFSFLYLPLL